MLVRFMLAVIVTMLATAIAPHRAERRVTLYPGSCPNGSAWYFIESTDDTVTVGCQDPDYEEPSEEPEDARISRSTT